MAKLGKKTSIAIVGAYLNRLHDIHRPGKGTPELSYRGPLENLFNEIGLSLDPKMQATAELGDTGTGRPDFGFFEIKSANLRAVAEVKSPKDDVPATADGAQIAKYWKQYGVVLVTNYRDFLLVVREDGSKARVEARYTLAADEDSFWQTKPSTLAELHGEGLVDFLTGVMRRSAPILRPRDLADDLARHAREARRRLERHDIETVQPLKEAMERSLGLHFEGEEGLAFFRSSLVQTLFYGLFSGWMLWRQQPHKTGSFQWKDASEYLALPLIGNLYEEIARPKRLGDLGLREPLEWATTSLSRVDETEFFGKFEQDHAITLFYEPFLESFDPELRKELGVWYTPPEIVKYMVGRVDQLLRTELKIENGLADESVYILDPAAGTGSYLVEVARKIHQTLTEQGHGQLSAAKVKKALTTRVFGFEILPAPYVVAHLQLGVLLRELGTKLAPDQRCGMYLTNALTGWEPPKGAKETLAFSFLQDEQEAAAKVKRDAPILVILGNPPYNGFAGVAQDEEADLIEPYKRGLYTEWGVGKQLLDDLYVRFYRLAERRIAEIGGRGIVCYIANSGWLDGLSHPIMREKLLKGFSSIWIDNCNGDRFRTGKRTPDGKPDQSMFTTDDQPVGINPGTAVATLVRTGPRDSNSPLACCHYRDLWGTANAKRQQLLDSLSGAIPEDAYDAVRIDRKLRYAIGRHDASIKYLSWESIDQFFRRQFKGVQPGRNGSLVSIDREQLAAQMKDYFDGRISNAEMRDRHPEVMADEARYDAFRLRDELLSRDNIYREDALVSVAWLPFDERRLYWQEDGKLLNEKRADFKQQVFPGSLFLACTQRPRKDDFPSPVVVSSLGSYYLFDPYASYLPLWIRQTDGFRAGQVSPNLNPDLLRDLCALCGESLYESDTHTFTKTANKLAETVFYHLLAILWSPAYRKENEAALRQDWPRVPIPADLSVLETSANIGRQIADLLLPDREVPGVTTGKLRSELRTLAIPSKLDGSMIEDPADTKVDAGWGFLGQRNAVMCGKGQTTPFKDNPDSLNIWINDKVYWANVPADVWKMTIGGYPVIKKWLSYREYKVLGRALKSDEIAYITNVVRRLKALLLLGNALDDNYRAAAKGKPLSCSGNKTPVE